MIKNYILQNIIFSICILVLDLPFIRFVMFPQYDKLFKSLKLKVGSKPVYIIMAYIFMILGFYLIKHKDSKTMLINGSILGLTVYGTYAFTLAAILPNYTPNLALMETAWGTSLYTLATLFTIIICRNV